LLTATVLTLGNLGVMHTRLDTGGVSDYPGRHGFLIFTWIREHYGHAGRRRWADLRGGHLVVMARCGFRTKYSIAPLHHIEIHLKDAALIPKEFDHQCN